MLAGKVWHIKLNGSTGQRKWKKTHVGGGEVEEWLKGGINASPISASTPANA